MRTGELRTVSEACFTFESLSAATEAAVALFFFTSSLMDLPYADQVSLVAVAPTRHPATSS